MKKLLAGILTAAVCGAALLGAAACGGDKDGAYSVYAPDGAPALALAAAISQDDDAYSYHVVSSATITTYVGYSDEAKNADFCVLPLNVASKLFGSGDTYRLLGTVTHGNLYFLTTGDNPALTAENLETALIGKTVGVVQLTNVPGLTLQATLSDYGISYQTIESLSTEIAEDKVNLLQMGTDATNVTPAYGCDYYLVPEPAVTAKIKGTASAENPFSLAGDLQELYGGENGFPQAVLIAKKSLIESDKSAVDKLISYFALSASYLETADVQTVFDLLADCRTEGLDPAFPSATQTSAVIANCSVYFTAAADCKTEINGFLAKLIEINAAFTSAASDDFFYAG